MKKLIKATLLVLMTLLISNCVTKPTLDVHWYKADGIGFIYCNNVEEDGKVNCKENVHMSTERARDFLCIQKTDWDLVEERTDKCFLWL